MSVLVWTRSPIARDTITLALSRVGLAVQVVGTVPELVELASGHDCLVLGPSFTREEAVQIGTNLSGDQLELRIVLIEDLARPLPSHTVVEAAPTRVLALPVRMRPLVEAVRGT